MKRYGWLQQIKILNIKAIYYVLNLVNWVIEVLEGFKILKTISPQITRKTRRKIKNFVTVDSLMQRNKMCSHRETECIPALIISLFLRLSRTQVSMFSLIAGSCV